MSSETFYKRFSKWHLENVKISICKLIIERNGKSSEIRSIIFFHAENIFRPQRNC